MMNFIKNTQGKYFWLLLGSAFWTLNFSAIANAIETKVNGEKIVVPFYLTKNAKSNSQNIQREYTFKAPDSKVISNTEQLTRIKGYKVEVYGNQVELLQQVKDIAPNAFVKGENIQVGIFSQQNNAEDLVRKLAVAGFWARITVQ